MVTSQPNADKEPDHLAAGIGAARLGVRARFAAAGPGMACAVQDPLLQQRASALVRVDPAGVTDSAQRRARADGGPQRRRRRFRLGDDLRADPTIYPPAELRQRFYTISAPARAYERQRNRAWTRITTGR
jgi:hypothetical protein